MPAQQKRKPHSVRRKVLILLGVSLALHASRYMVKDPGFSRRHLGLAKINGWLRAPGSTGRSMLGMSSRTFKALETHLSPFIKEGRRGQQTVTAREQLGIFLYMCRFAATCRQAADLFGRSPTTVSLLFQSMIRILVKPQVFNEHVFLPPLSDHPIPERITNDPGLFPFFKSVLGAIDGSHVPAHVPSTQRDPFWNRKGYTSFNVLAACDFDLCFIYVLSGWEGSASDSYLWQKAIASALKLPEKRRLLADAGFGFSRHLLVPYRGVRYHLKEYEAGTKRPRNAQELYNRRHAGARSVIERIFGVIQARFRILVTGCHFDVQTQADLFPALAVVHNFIRRHDPVADIVRPVSRRSGEVEEVANQTTATAESKKAAADRDRIARKMWSAYTPCIM